MYYQLSEFYRRDISFVYKKNIDNFEYFELMNGTKLTSNKAVVYEVDEIDKYISDYDILPTIGAPLVSNKFKTIFDNLSGKELDFLEAVIKDKKGNTNNDFFCINILNVIDCLDEKRSVIEKKTYGDAVLLNIKKLFCLPNSLDNYSIVRMEEHKSYIIVTDEFKKQCEDTNLKGIEFIEEGHSICSDI